MGGYIGATAVGLVTTAADVQGDITSTDTTPEVILKNTTETDADGSRDGKITFKGEQSGGEESTLAQIQSSHDGTSDDQKGDLIFKTNDGSDGASPTERLRIDSGGVVTITRADNGTQLNLKSTDADGSGGPILDLTRDSATPADGDVLGLVRFKGDDAGGNETTYAQMIGFIEDEAAGAEDGTFKIETLIGGSSQARLDMTSTETVFNEGSIDLDFRVESDNDANALFVQGPDGHVGIGNSSPSSQDGSANNLVVEDSAGSGGITIKTPTNGIGSIHFSDGTSGADRYRGIVSYSHSENSMRFHTDTARAMTIDSSGNLLVGNAIFNSNVESLNLNTFAVEQATGRCLISASVQPMELARTAGDTNSRAHIQIFREGANVGAINTTGSATSFVTSSDYRLKENVTNVTDGITRVKQLLPKRFNFIIDADTTVDGFLAHEVSSIVPEAVSGDKDAMMDEEYEVKAAVTDDDGNVVKEAEMGTRSVPDYQGIDQSKIVPLLTAALQEAIAKIETLETKVAALEG